MPDATAFQVIKLGVLHMSCWLMRKGCKTIHEFTANVRVAAATMVIASAVSDRAISRRVRREASSEEVIIVATSFLGGALGKRERKQTVTVEKHDLMCLVRTRLWCLLYVIAGFAISYLAKDPEPLFIGASLCFLRATAEPAFFVHVMNADEGAKKVPRPFHPPSVLNSLLGAPHSLP